MANITEQRIERLHQILGDAKPEWERRLALELNDSKRRYTVNEILAAMARATLSVLPYREASKIRLSLSMLPSNWKIVRNNNHTFKFKSTVEMQEQPIKPEIKAQDITKTKMIELYLVIVNDFLNEGETKQVAYLRALDAISSLMKLSDVKEDELDALAAKIAEKLGPDTQILI